MQALGLDAHGRSVSEFSVDPVRLPQVQVHTVDDVLGGLNADHARIVPSSPAIPRDQFPIGSFNRHKRRLAPPQPWR